MTNRSLFLAILSLLLVAPFAMPRASASITCEKNTNTWSPVSSASVTVTAYACPTLTAGRFTTVVHTVTASETGTGFQIKNGYYAWTGYYYSSSTDYKKIYYHEDKTLGTLNNGKIILNFGLNRAPNWIYTVSSLSVVYLPTGEPHTLYAISFDCIYPAC